MASQWRHPARRLFALVLLAAAFAPLGPDRHPAGASTLPARVRFDSDRHPRGTYTVVIHVTRGSERIVARLYARHL